MAFGPFEHYFATAHRAGVCAVFALDRPSPVRLFTGHSSDVSCCRWHPSSGLVVTGSDDRTVRLWDLRSAQGVRTLSDGMAAVSCVAVSHDGYKAAAGLEDGSVLLWDLYSGRVLAKLMAQKHSVHSVAFHAFDSTLVSGV